MNREDRAVAGYPREYVSKPDTSTGLVGQKEAGLKSKAIELLKHISELENELASTQELLFFACKEPADEKNEAPYSVDDMIRMASQRVASLVGFAATINKRLN